MSDPIEHYVYRVVLPETGQYYIGCRRRYYFYPSYLGGGKWPRAMKKAGKELKREVLLKIRGCRAARRAEKQLIHKHWNDPLCMNLFISGKRQKWKRCVHAT